MRVGGRQPGSATSTSSARAEISDAQPLHVQLRKRRSSNASDHFQLDVDFVVAPGVTVVVGQSGAGKTTILQCIAGLSDPEEGRVTVGDRVLFDSQTRTRLESSRRRVAFVVQNLALFPHLSVEKNVMYGLRRLDQQDRRRRMQQVLESFQISHLCRRSPRQISGGEQQRVALARALVTEPSVLLLDEPLSSLDPKTKVRIIEDLQRWNDARRIPILYVTHDRGELVALGDQVIVLERGRIVEQGSPTSVTLAPARAAAQRAGFENVFDATVVEHREPEGTMACRVTGTEIVLVAPSAPIPVGSEISLGVRAADILVSSSRPTVLSACNVLPGSIRQIERNGSVLDARVAGGAELRVRMDARTAESSGVKVPMEVWAMFGTQACHLVRPVHLDPLRRLFVFVCNGNTIRSPMAQAICNAEIASRFNLFPGGLDWRGIMAMSAGLKARPGEPLDEEAKRALGEIGMPALDHRSQNLTHRLAERAEAIFCMTERQRTELVATFPAAEAKSHRLHPDLDIDDPHGRAGAGFVDCALHIQDLVRLRLTDLGIPTSQTPTAGDEGVDASVRL